LLVVVADRDRPSALETTMTLVRSYSRLPFLVTLAMSAASAQAAETAAPASAAEAYRAVFQDSLDNRRGIIVFVNGQSIPGAVVRLIGSDAVELRNQEHGRIVVRIDRIDGVAAP
jgi:hypothetical protein